MPEVATSIMAAIRGERDIAVGNVVGSNIFNILAVLGISSAVSPGGVKVTQAALTMDIPVMIAVAAACLPVFFIGHIISRWNGVLFLAYYFAYTATFVIAEMVPGYHRTYASTDAGACDSINGHHVTHRSRPFDPAEQTISLVHLRIFPIALNRFCQVPDYSIRGREVR
jgi:hypothetical protein